MNKFDQCVNQIISASDDSTLAIFVGAGISKTSETGSFTLPSWNDLITELKQELNLENEYDFLKIAQLYYLASGGFTYYKKLKKYFPDNIQPSEIHKLIFEIKPQVVITTNWDTILENTIQQNAYIYDVISSDKDLVKSSLGRKLIKMHGDFRNHNIVFKEDDYLNYAQNFPLIENYVKSILSTHTVLFLGYSYSDIDIKHVIKWIQSHSDVRPPMYLAVFKDDPTQRKYLENHGITTLLMEKTSGRLLGANDYTQRLEYLLYNILTKNRHLVVESPNEVIDFLYRRLVVLGELNYVLLDQVQKVLSNCGYLYEPDSTAIITFYDKLLTGDYDESTRLVFASFLKIIVGGDEDEDEKQLANSKVAKIFEILKKSGIKGIASELDATGNRSTSYLALDPVLNDASKELFSSTLDFSSKQSSLASVGIFENICDAYIKFQKNEYKDALDILDQVVSECLKQRQYTWLFISLFNMNVLIRHLKHGLETIGKYDHLKEYDLTEKYNNLPRDAKVALEPIFEFTNFDYLYRYAFRVEDELRKKEESSRVVKSGGMVFDSDSNKSAVQHVNLVNFVVRNCIMIDNFVEYKEVQRRLVSIALARQVQRDSYLLTKIELFSCIKSMDNKYLKELLNDCFAKDDSKKKPLVLAEEDQSWLVSVVLPNLVDSYIASRSPFKVHEEYVVNTIFLISLLKLSPEQIGMVISLVTKVVSESNNSIGIYQSINLFLGIQFNLYQSPLDPDSIIRLVETMIGKIVNHRMSGYEFIAFSRNEVSNLYGYAQHGKAVFENVKLINRLLNEVGDYNTDEQVDLAQSLLLSLYQISNEDVRLKIKEFILKIDISSGVEDYKKLIFGLSLSISGLKKIEESLIEELEKFVSIFKDSKSFTSVLYTLRSQIVFLAKERAEKRLEGLMELIGNIIINYEANRTVSRF